MENTNIKHVFELAGLGIAPFTFVTATFGDWTNCEYCGQAIKERCLIKDVNGTIFIVGNECVNKTGDTGLINATNVVIKELRKKRKQELDLEKINTAKVLLYKFPHFSDKIEINSAGKYYSEKLISMFANSTLNYGGQSYKVEIAKAVIKTVKSHITAEEFDNIINNFESLKDEYLKYITSKEAQARLEQEERNRRFQEEQRLKNEKIAAQNAELISVLKSLPYVSNFAEDMAIKLTHTELKNLSLRQIAILADIYGKHFGRRGSKAYNVAYDTIANF